jgi:hypothetical protein
MPAHLGIGDDDVTARPTAEHHASPLQRDPEHLFTLAKEDQHGHGQFLMTRERELLTPSEVAIRAPSANF